MIRIASLTARLAALFAALTACLLVLVAVLFGRILDPHFQELDAHDLHGKLTLIRNALQASSAPPLSSTPFAVLDQSFVGRENLGVLLRDTEGRVLHVIHPEHFTPAQQATEEWGYRMPDNRRYGGRPLAQSTLYHRLGNPFYAGYFYWNGRLYPGKHQPMVTMDEFQRVQSLIGRPGTQKPQKYTFPFTGLIHCGECGLMVTAEHHINRYGSHYIYYRCTKRHGSARCRQPYIGGAELEAQFIHFIERITLDAETALELSQQVVAEHQNGALQFHNARANIDREIQSLGQQLSTLTDLRVRGLIQDEEYMARRRDIELATAAAEDRMKTIESGPEWFEPAQLLVSFSKQALDWFAHGTDDIKRSIVSAVGSNFTLADKQLRGEAKNPFSLRVEEPTVLYRSGFLDDIRTLFESQDESFLKLLENVREISATVEAVARAEASRPSAPCGPVSRTGSRVPSSGPSRRRRKGPRHSPLSSSHGTARLSPP